MSSCYEIPCVKLKDSDKWILRPEPIKLVTKYGCGWSDSLVDNIKVDGYYFLYGKVYSYNDEIKISTEESYHCPYNKIMSFIINIDHKNDDRFNRLVFDYLVKFSASSIRNLKLKEIGV
jgi:hypothetical protein